MGHLPSARPRRHLRTSLAGRFDAFDSPVTRTPLQLRIQPLSVCPAFLAYTLDTITFEFLSPMSLLIVFALALRMAHLHAAIRCSL
jgi:hypothetical protein